MSTLDITRVSGVTNSIRDAYNVAGFRPPLVMDPKRDKYIANGAVTTFADATEFTRASSATFMDANGVLQTAATGVARTAHHFYKDGVLKRGALFEPTAATNLFVRSKCVSTTGLSHGGLTLETDQDFLGITTAFGMAAGASRWAYTVATLVDAAPYTVSCLVQCGDGLAPSFGAGSITGNTNEFVIVVGGSFAGATTDYIVEHQGGTTYRVTGTGISTSTSGTVGLVKYSGNIADSLKVTDIQVVAGSIPSSSIETNGSPATRAADVLTVPHEKMPWPEVEYIGPELVTNGTFDTNLSGWTETGGLGVVAWSASGALFGNGNGVASTSFAQNVTTVVGKVYRCTVDISGTGTGVQVFVNGIGQGTYFSTPTSRVFVATSTSTPLSFFRFRGHTGQTLIDNVSVREITPLAVSIHLEGFMTGPTARLLNWSRDANTEILMDTGSSTFTFTQEAGGVVDTVAGGIFTDGVNVPFNVAMTASSNLLAGAANGTALTDNTTPIALPDLEPTDMRLAFSGGPIILTLFTVTPANITQAGRVEATS